MAKIRAFFVLACLVFLGAGILSRALEAPPILRLIIDAAAYFFGGFFTLSDIFAAGKRKQIEVDLLMILAAAGAAIVDAWQEGGMLLFLFSLSNLLQDQALRKTKSALSSLLRLRPDQVRILVDGAPQLVKLEAAGVGQTLILGPGDRIPVDALLLRGETNVDESALTGEALPVFKSPGDELRAGSLNLSGACEAEIRAPSSDSSLSRIIKLVEEARDKKSRIHSRLEQLEQGYALFVIGAVAMYIVIGILLGAEAGPHFYRGMTLLTVASPCALIMSIPAGMLSAMSSAARKGVLFKGGIHLETLAGISVLAMDKTGTLTLGKPRVTDVLPEPGVSAEELLEAAVQAEGPSEHPIGRAVCRHAADLAEKTGRKGPALAPLDSFEAVAGMGVRASWEDRNVLIGTEKIMERFELRVPPELIGRLTGCREQGKTVLLVYDTGRWLGSICLADTPRPGLRKELAALRTAGLKKIFMLTGDTEQNARALAEEYGLDGWYAGLLPTDKASVVAQLERQFGQVLMVGDGINDAPALASASCSTAMGAIGTDTALESADLVLMKDDLLALAWARRLAGRTRRIVWQNIAFALSVILVMVGLTLAAGIPLTLGVLAHEGSTVLVILNGLRLLAA